MALSRKHSFSLDHHTQFDKETLAIDSFIVEIKCKKYNSQRCPSLHVAIRTIELLRFIITSVGRCSIESLLKTIRKVGKTLETECGQFSEIIGNVTRRVLYIVREEFETALNEPYTPGSGTPVIERSAPPMKAVIPFDLDSPLSPDSSSKSVNDTFVEQSTDSFTSALPSDVSLISPVLRCMSALNPSLVEWIESEVANPTPNLQEKLWSKGKWKQLVLQHIADNLEEMTATMSNICQHVKDVMSEKECVLTIGHSNTVELFLRQAAKRDKIGEVIIAEHYPECSGHRLALLLAQAGIKTTIISDAEIFAIMSRVNKVLVGTHIVLANGGIVARSGTHMLAVAARYHRTPFVVLTGLHKLCPTFPVNPSQFSNLASPTDIISFTEMQAFPRLQVRNPQCDYVAPDFVHTYITNNGCCNRSYIYRLVAEMYNPEDYVL